MIIPGSCRRRAWLRATAATALAVTVVGCGGSDSDTGSATASATARPSPAVQTADVQGTWQTPDIPLDEARAVYEGAGGSTADAEAFVDQLGFGSAQSTVQLQFRAQDGVWDEYERADHGELARG